MKMKLNGGLSRFCLVSMLSLGVCAAVAKEAQALLVDLSAEARTSAQNDEVRAVVFAQADGSAPAEVARLVNRQIDLGLQMAKKIPTIKAQTGNTQTYPVYGKNSRIESWRMRSEIILVSQDAAQMAELLGRLQGTLGVSSITNSLSPAAFLKAENRATIEAISAFKEKAKLIASSFGKTYRLVSINVGGQPMGLAAAPMARAMLSSSEAMLAPPVEGGESEISVRVTGRIEIAD
jgi:predicted secreted protein